MLFHFWPPSISDFHSRSFDIFCFVAVVVVVIVLDNKQLREEHACYNHVSVGMMQINALESIEAQLYIFYLIILIQL